MCRYRDDIWLKVIYFLSDFQKYILWILFFDIRLKTYNYIPIIMYIFYTSLVSDQTSAWNRSTNTYDDGFN